MLRNWVVVYFGNLIGAVFIAALVVFGGVFNGSEGALLSTATGKILPFGPALFRGILCNILVCMGVLMAGAAKDAAGKVIAQFFPVAAFVMAGYEHCVANMYYFSAALFADSGVMTFGQLLQNMIPVTLGNIIGGGIVLGAGYWYAYRKN
jgi:formate/nitrite transporter